MSNEFLLRMLPQAELDLDNIYSHITYVLENPQTAMGLIAKIEKELLNLTFMPKRYPLSDISELANAGYRKCIIDDYIALFRIDEKRKLVIVATVFHGMRDYKNLGSVLSY